MWLLAIALAAAAPPARAEPAALGDPAAQGDSAARGDPPTDADRARMEVLRAQPAPLVDTTPRFLPDGSVLFISNEGGGAALWRTKPGGAPEKLAWPLPRRFRRPVVMPDGDRVAFTADDRGDEAYQLLTLSLASGEVRPLVPAPAAGEPPQRRDGPWLSADGKRTLYWTRAMTEAGTRLVEHIEGGPARVVYESATLGVTDIRADAAALLVTPLSTVNALSIVDLPGGAARELFPRDGRGIQIHAASFTPDGKRVLVLTDDGGEQATLLLLDARTGRERARYVERAFPASTGLELVVAEDRVALVIDAGVEHAVRILDVRTLKPVEITPPLPTGSSIPGVNHPNFTSGVSLSADGQKLAVQWSTPSTPARIHLIDTRTGARTPLVPAHATPDPRLASIETRVERIPTFDALTLPTLVHRPAGDDARRPVIVSMHGGFPFASTARFDARIRAWLERGFIVVEPNVRGSGGFGRAYEEADDGTNKLDALRDMGAIARWLRAQPWADASRLVLMGGSAGGYWTLLGLAHDPDTWRCGVALMPLVDVAASIGAIDGDLRDFWERRELVPLSEPMILRALSPITYADRMRAPLFVLGAARDVRTPIAPIEALVTQLRAQGTRVEYMRSSAGHSFDDPQVRLEVTARVERFVDTQCR